MSDKTQCHSFTEFDNRFLCRGSPFAIDRFDVAKELIELDQEFDQFNFTNDDISAIRNVVADNVIIHAYKALMKIDLGFLRQLTPKT